MNGLNTVQPTAPNFPDLRPSVAVIGSGVSGLTAAYVLNRTHRVVLLEADDRLGGHAHTHQIDGVNGKSLSVDSGFIVHNDRTYPLLRKLFAELGVAARPTEMSMSVRHEASGLEYAGGAGLRGLTAQPRRLLSGEFLGMLRQVRKFHTAASRFLAETDQTDDTSYGRFLEQQGFSQTFQQLYALPVVACVWSCGSGTAAEYPARFLFQFLDHHGMLSLGGSPQWYTIAGGSQTYVQALAARLPDVRIGHKVTQVQRLATGVAVTDDTGGVTQYDKVVIATHADQALTLLADPTPDEHQVLGALSYTTNHTVLHTDSSLLPRSRRARSSWNYLVPVDHQPGPLVTYWMNKLQGLPGPTDYLVTLNADERIDPSKVLARMEYRHPVYDVPSAAARRRLPALNTSVTAFAGAYHGWGFHEDGCRAGVVAAQALGAQW